MTDSIPMNKLSQLIESVAAARHDSDFVDRLNYRVTTLVLLFTATALFAKDYIGQPIRCWGSPEWRGGWSEYAHDICFVENTYYVPVAEARLPHDAADRQRLQIGYYQWVPFILVLQALCFLVPHYVWRSFHWLISGIEIRAILCMADEARQSVGGLSHSARSSIAFHLRRALDAKYCAGDHFVHATDDGNDADESGGEMSSSSISSTLMTMTSKRKRHSFRCKLRRFICQHALSVNYCAVKALFLINAFVQFNLLGVFLGRHGIATANGGAEEGGGGGWLSFQFRGLSGYSSAWRWLRGEDAWETVGLFPRVTLCDFQIRTQGGHIENNTVQCVLVGNMINEKVFIGLWWWLVVLNALTAVNLVQWARRLFVAGPRERLVARLLPSSVVDVLYPLAADRFHDVREMLAKMEKEEPTEEAPKMAEQHHDNVEKDGAAVEHEYCSEAYCIVDAESFWIKQFAEAEAAATAASASFPPASAVSDATTTGSSTAVTNLMSFSFSNATLKVSDEKEQEALTEQQPLARQLSVTERWAQLAHTDERYRRWLRQQLNARQLGRRRRLALKLERLTDVCAYLGADGALALELMRINAGELIAAAVLAQIVDDHFRLEGHHYYRRCAASANNDSGNTTTTKANTAHGFGGNQLLKEKPQQQHPHFAHPPTIDPNNNNSIAHRRLNNHNNNNNSNKEQQRF